jgi:hypothetical protein
LSALKDREEKMPFLGEVASLSERRICVQLADLL